MADPYYAPDGKLMVWTGTGYQAIPTIAAGDVGDMTREEQVTRYQQGDSEREERIAGFNGYGITNLSPYGDLSWMHPSYNFAAQPGGSQDAFSYLLKSDDKVGTEIKYVRQPDGSYKPTVAGAQQWDTNQNSAMALAPLAAAFAAAALGGGAAAGGAASGGSNSAAFSGMLGEGLAGGATGGGAFGGMTAGGTLGGMTGGAGSLVPGSLAGSLGPGFASGLGGLGSLTPSASTLAAWDALAPSITGVGGGASGGSSWLDKVPKALQNPSNLSSLAKLGGLLAGGVLGAKGVEEQPGQTSTPQPVPTMYGGSGPPKFNMYGDTETERRMAQQYLPGLFNRG